MKYSSCFLLFCLMIHEEWSTSVSSLIKNQSILKASVSVSSSASLNKTQQKNFLDSFSWLWAVTLERECERGHRRRDGNIFIVLGEELREKRSEVLSERRPGLPLHYLQYLKQREITAMLVGGWLRAKCPDSDSSAQMHISQSREGNYREV